MGNGVMAIGPQLPRPSSTLPLVDRVGNERLDLLDRLHVISDLLTAPGSNPSATFIAPAVSVSRLVNAS